MELVLVLVWLPGGRCRLGLSSGRRMWLLWRGMRLPEGHWFWERQRAGPQPWADEESESE